jgi:hypothetical protein
VLDQALNDAVCRKTVHMQQSAWGWILCTNCQCWLTAVQAMVVGPLPQRDKTTCQLGELPSTHTAYLTH